MKGNFEDTYKKYKDELIEFYKQQKSKSDSDKKPNNSDMQNSHYSQAIQNTHPKYAVDDYTITYDTKCTQNDDYKIDKEDPEFTIYHDRRYHSQIQEIDKDFDHNSSAAFAVAIPGVNIQPSEGDDDTGTQSGTQSGTHTDSDEPHPCPGLEQIREDFTFNEPAIPAVNGSNSPQIQIPGVHVQPSEGGADTGTQSGTQSGTHTDSDEPHPCPGLEQIRKDFTFNEPAIPAMADSGDANNPNNLNNPNNNPNNPNNDDNRPSVYDNFPIPVLPPYITGQPTRPNILAPNLPPESTSPILESTDTDVPQTIPPATDFIEAEQPPQSPQDSFGELTVVTRAAKDAYPIPNATVIIEHVDENGGVHVISVLKTNSSGLTQAVKLGAPPKKYSFMRDSSVKPYTYYDIVVSLEGFYKMVYKNVPIFDGVKSIQSVDMIPLPSDSENQRIVRYIESAPEL